MYINPPEVAINTPVQTLALTHCSGAPVRIVGMSEPMEISRIREESPEGTAVFFNGSSGTVMHGTALRGNNSVLAVSIK